MSTFLVSRKACKAAHFGLLSGLAQWAAMVPTFLTRDILAVRSSIKLSAVRADPHNYRSRPKHPRPTGPFPPPGSTIPKVLHPLHIQRRSSQELCLRKPHLPYRYRRTPPNRELRLKPPPLPPTRRQIRNAHVELPQQVRRCRPRNRRKLCCQDRKAILARPQPRRPQSPQRDEPSRHARRPLARQPGHDARRLGRQRRRRLEG